MRAWVIIGILWLIVTAQAQAQVQAAEPPKPAVSMAPDQNRIAASPTPPVRTTVAPVQRAEAGAQDSGWRTNLQLGAILAAVVIFAAREILESFRRRAAQQRKLDALKAVIARECELNNYTTSVLKREIESMKENFELEDGDVQKSEYRVVFRRDGSAVLEELLGGNWGGSHPIPKVYVSMINAKIVELAELDPKLYAKAEAALSGLAELEHVRTSLISYVMKEDDNMPHLLENFPDYALGEIEDSSAALRELYTACTGRPLTDRRLR